MELTYVSSHKRYVQGLDCLIRLEDLMFENTGLNLTPKGIVPLETNRSWKHVSDSCHCRTVT